MSDSQGLTIAELEAKYFLYRKALKQLLLEEGPLPGLRKPCAGAGLKPSTTVCPANTNRPITSDISSDARSSASRVTACSAAQSRADSNEDSGPVKG